MERKEPIRTEEDMKRIHAERDQLRAYISRHHGGSYWKFAKTTGLPPTTVINYVDDEISKKHTGGIVDLRNIKLDAKVKLYAATKLELFDPMRYLPQGVNDWQRQLYLHMVQNNKSRKVLAAELGMPETTLCNYFQEPITLEHIKNVKARENIYRIVGRTNGAPAATPQLEQKTATPASVRKDTPEGSAPAGETARNGIEATLERIERGVAALGEAVPILAGNGELTKGTRTLVRLLNANLERYVGSDKAQEQLRGDRVTIELFGRCHELLSAIYQNNPFTAHRLKTTYKGEQP